MSNNDLFKNNVERWILMCPKEALRLSSLQCLHTSLCQTGKGELNLKRDEEGTVEYYHSTEDAEEEANRWFKSLDLYNVGTLFVYGVGLGYYFRAAKEWLDQQESHSIIFLEDDLEVIHRLFETDIGSELMNHKRVRLQYFSKSENEDDEDSDLLSIPFFYFMGDIKFSALKYYTKKYSDSIGQLDLQLEYIKNCKAFQIMEYMNYGETFFQNFYRNILELPSGYQSDKLFQRFSGIPAIICGAGPSLEKSIPLLKKLGNKALIFAGGSSINVINSHDILPDFGVSIDPNWNQYARLFMNNSYQVPFFYRNRIFPQALSLIQGDHLYVSGSGGHEIAGHFEKELGIEENSKISEGNNVVNFSLSIAQKLGCNPIILVGVDLAYTNNQSYTSGIIPHPILDANREITTRGPKEQLITKKDIYGNLVYTLWKWISESLWVSEFAAYNPRNEVLNATEGGIGFNGVPNLTKEEVENKIPTLEMDLKSYIHGEIQNSQMPPTVSKEKILSIMNELLSSLERCAVFCLKIRQEYHKLWKEMKATNTSPENLISEKALNNLKELNQEPAYASILSEFNKAFLTFFTQREKATEFDVSGGEIDLVKLNIKRTLLNKKRYEFLRAVAKSSLRYIKQALEADKLINLVSEVFGKEIEEAKRRAQKELAPEMEKAVVYKHNKEKFWIDDDDLGLSFEEKLVSSPVKEINSLNELANPEENIAWEGCCKLLYPSRNLKMEQFYKKGKLHGPSSYYSESGTLLARSWFVNGQRQGAAQNYYYNGTLHSIQRYKDGELHGKQEYYYPNGKIKSTLEYQNGLLHGTVIQFYGDGFKKRELHFNNGKRHGLEILWNIGGIKEFEGSYQLDKPVGIFRSWYPFGNPSREIHYDEQGNIQDIKGWDSDATPLPIGALMKKDYFDLVKDETNTLTGSLESVYKEVESMTAGLTELMKEKTSGNPLDFTEDLKELKKEMENLKAMNIEMNQESQAVSTETAEALWKTPEAKRLMGQHIQNATQKMTEDLQSLEEILRMTSEILAEREKDSKEDQEN